MKLADIFSKSFDPQPWVEKGYQLPSFDMAAAGHQAWSANLLFYYLLLLRYSLSRGLVRHESARSQTKRYHSLTPKYSEYKRKINEKTNYDLHLRSGTE